MLPRSFTARARKGELRMRKFLLLFAGVGWAKPVPVNPYYFTKVDRRAGIALTALAGPMSNILMALLTMILYKAVLLLPLLP